MTKTVGGAMAQQRQEDQETANRPAARIFPEAKHHQISSSQNYQGIGIAKKATSQPGFHDRPKGGRDRILGLMALFKLSKAALLLAVGIGALKLVRTDLAAWSQHWVSALTSNVARRTVEQLLARVSQMDPGRLEALGVGTFLYAALFMVEGIGLWRGQRWAEYLTVIATASFVPLEIYELTHRVSLLRLSALFLNLAIVAYLIYRLRCREAKT